MAGVCCVQTLSAAVRRISDSAGETNISLRGARMVLTGERGDYLCCMPGCPKVVTLYFETHPTNYSYGIIYCWLHSLLLEQFAAIAIKRTFTHTHPFNGPFTGSTQVSRYQKDKTNLDFTEARDSEWQWHQLGHMQVCTSLQTDNHTSTPPLCFLQAGCPSCRPTNSVKALKANKRTFSGFHFVNCSKLWHWTIAVACQFVHVPVVDNMIKVAFIFFCIWICMIVCHVLFGYC